MSSNRTMLEVIAPSVEEAIEKGLSELGVSKSDVDIEILDEGKKNLFKLMSRQSRVRLIVKETQPINEPAIEEKEDSQTIAIEDVNFQDAFEESLELSDQTLISAQEVIHDLLEKMGIKAEIEAKYGKADKTHTAPVSVNIKGNDLSFLIGRKSETLNALQYIASLMLGNRLNRWVPLQIDVQNYRERREMELRKLARRMADQVITTGRSQYFEPMPANERRIIHMELRENPEVETHSTGEEPFRKVTITLKR